MEDNMRNWEILNIEVRTKMSTDELNLSEDLKIDVHDINKEFCEQPALYAYWATVATQAKSLYEKKKLEVEKKEDYIRKTLVGTLDVTVRHELEMNGEKITEQKVLNGIYSSTEYRDEMSNLYELKEELLELQSQLSVLDIARESMNQRKDMLISLGAQLRQEGNNLDLTINQMSSKASEIVGKRKAIKQ